MTQTSEILEEITVEDSAEVSGKLDIVSGKTIQNGIPSTKNPIEIRNVESIKFRTSNKNLYASEVFTKTIRGVNCIFDENSTLKMNGTATSSGGRTDTKNLSKITLKKGKKYTLFSEKISGTGTSGHIYLNKINDNTSYKSCIDDTVSSFYVAEDIDVYWGININQDAVFNNLILRLGLFEGEYTFNEIKDMFVTHKGQTITFPLNVGQVLHKGDYLSDDGIHNTKRRIELDGTENYLAYNEYENGYAFILQKYNSITAKTEENQTNIKCNMLMPATNNGSDTIRIVPANGNIVLIFNKNFVEHNVDSLKLKITELYNAGTPIVIEIPLEKQTIEKYNEEQKQVYYELQHLMMYKNYTNITCTDEIKPNIQLTYYYNNDLNKSYGKRFDDLENNKAEKTDLDTKMNLYKNRKALTKKGWYRVANLNYGNYIIEITQTWNNMRPCSMLLAVSAGAQKYNISILNAEFISDNTIGISQARLVRDTDATSGDLFLEIYYNYNVSNNVTVQVINESTNSNTVELIHFTETTSEDIFVKATKDMRILHLDDAIGTLSSLTTTDKTSLVNALNELRLQAFTYMRGTNIGYTNILTNKTFDDAMNLEYSTIFTINGNEETKNGAGFPTGAYQYGLLITLFSPNYAKVQIYIPDKPSERGFYIRTKGDPWCHFSGEIVQPISNE